MFFLFKWVSNLFHTIKVKIAPVVSSILQILKGAEDTGILDGIASLIDNLTHGHIASDVNALIKTNVTKGIATFLTIQDLPDNPTPDDIKKFENDVVTAIAGKAAADSIPGQSYTNLGAELYNIIQTSIADAEVAGTPLTFAQIAEKLEEAYQALLKAQADAKAVQDETQA